jgi:hypothetical protein
MKEESKTLLVLNLETEQIILQHMDSFRGVGTTLESALGALVLGQYFGWRVLKIMHNPSTYRRYETVLGVKFKDVCPEITETGKRKSIGYAITQKLGSFWAVILGKRKVPQKGFIGNAEDVERRLSEIESNSEGVL